MKQIKEWKEPWKRKEPGVRLSQKEKRHQSHYEQQRSHMEAVSTQKVKIYCNKNVFLPPGLFTSFTVKVKIPLRESEFMERMRAAFPELRWEER